MAGLWTRDFALLTDHTASAQCSVCGFRMQVLAAASDWEATETLRSMVVVHMRNHNKGVWPDPLTGEP